jgi:ABC-2 type transport system ATP-binding protein
LRCALGAHQQQEPAVSEPVLQAAGLSKWYGPVAGLIDLSVEVGPGVTGLLGPNGAGKSTLLKLVTGQLRPSRGELRVMGRRPWNATTLFAQIGYCSEGETYYPAMSGLGFVTLMARLAGADGATARKLAEDALATVQLGDAATRPIRTYSKGMRQKVKVAQAIVHHPRLLVLDEPLNGLDPLGRRHLVGLVRDLGERGVSVLVSSHVLHEVEAMTESILLLHQGRLLAFGGVRELRGLIDRHPHHIEIVCDRPRELARLLLDSPDVKSLSLEETRGALVVESLEPDLFYARLPDLVVEHRFEVQSLHSPDDNLEAVFRYLVKR